MNPKSAFSLAALWVYRQAYRLYRRVIPVPLSREQLEFMRLNAAFWRAMRSSSAGRPSSGYVLVPVEAHPVIAVCDASFASIVARARNLELLFIVSFSSTSVIARLLASYPNAHLLYLRSWRYAFLTLRATLEALRAYRSMRTPRDLLDFEADGIRFGDILYDAVLAKGYATIDRVDLRVFDVLRSFYFRRGVAKHALTRYDIKAAVFPGAIGLAGGTFSRYLVQQGCEVMTRFGANKIHVRKARSLKDLRVDPSRPDQHYFKAMMAVQDGAAERTVKDYLERRFSHAETELGGDLAFDLTKTTFTDRASFCASHQLDPGKPLVFVMLHAFNDNPHAFVSKPMLFQDYYFWTMRTLEIALEREDVNWVFKEHPYADYYRTKDVNLSALFHAVNSGHIRFVSRDADFNAQSIRHLGDAVITCIGTSGLEHAAFGIPCVQASDSLYSGFGFTVEPSTAAEYDQCLRNIGQLKRLTPIQVKAARVVGYFYFCVMRGTEYYFCPALTETQIARFTERVANQLWRQLASRFEDDEHAARMRKQVDDLGAFVLDASRTQYIDLERFPFFAGAVGSGTPMSDETAQERAWVLECAELQ